MALLNQINMVKILPFYDWKLLLHARTRLLLLNNVILGNNADQPQLLPLLSSHNNYALLVDNLELESTF